MIWGLYDDKRKQRKEFAAVTIGIASPEKILSWSHGEVKKAETINYRTFRPERDGLFCERIFGPTKDWECACGKYKRIKNRNVICDRCGVEVTESRVRRERMGHIKLVSPVAHIWFVKGAPNYVANLLGISSRDLERVVYYASYLVVDPGLKSETGLAAGQVISEEQYRGLYEKFPGEFVAEMGAPAVRRLLEELDLETLSVELKVQLDETRSKQKRKTLLKRLQLVESVRKSGNRPEWMVLEVLPVLPPDLRPLVPLDGGRFATSDLNDLYRTVINRNNRLRKLIEIKAPDVILRNEKRMLQESVDALLDNGRRGYAVRGVNNRPLKSLSDNLKGKLGRFRQNLLGKRVDYSGRAVIVVGPELKLHECGIPKKMALELFKPFIIQKLEEHGFVHTIKSAKRLVEQVKPEVWDILEECIRDHPVMLNRAPTLHRLGIQAFKPVLVEGSAIRIHPLVCTAFNADFDGDQMAVHVPLSPEAQLEAKLLMASTRNILSPAHGKPLATPTQDIVLGCYALTKPKEGEKGQGKAFADVDEVTLAHELGEVGRYAKVKVRLYGELIDTTVGRVLFNEVLPDDFVFVNKTVDKKTVGGIVAEVYKKYGLARTVSLLDDLKDLGFLHATLAGVTFGVDDLVVPPEKATLIEETKREVEKIDKLYKQQAITYGERYNMVIDAWTRTTDVLGELVFDRLSKDAKGFNPVFIMADSGARGSQNQIRQLCGLRGLMAKPQKKITGRIGEIIEQPILSNFREGLSVLEYFISTHGGRKGLADTALKTADAGYLTRRLVDAAHDLIVTEGDCRTLLGIEMTALKEGEEVIASLGDRVLGRVALEDLYDPVTGELIVAANQLIDEEEAEKIEMSNVTSAKIRSVLTCESRRGVCTLCYGKNLAAGKLVDVGEAVGVIAAQSIGEPGTQLTLRTFHVGGTASRIVEQSKISAKVAGKARFERLRKVKRPDGSTVVLSRNAELNVVDEEGRDRIKYTVPYGAALQAKDGQLLEKGQVIYEWDPYSEPILADVDGVVELRDIIDGVTLREEVDAAGLIQRVVVGGTRRKDLDPHIIVHTGDGGKDVEYPVPFGGYLSVHDGERVEAGKLLVKLPREIGKTRDITGGLPRVAELFEARRPKNPAIIAEIDGHVEIKGTRKGKRKIVVGGEHQAKEYEIPQGKHLKVHEGDLVTAGQQLCDGNIDPHDILRVKGDKEVQEYLVNEIQEVYRLQGVDINDKHLESIVRKMLRKVKIETVGDTEFLPEQVVDKFKFRDINEKMIGQGKKPATASPILQGITEAALSTDSFISAASFQKTTHILAEAAFAGKRDNLLGLKENVIMGHLIPAGLGAFDALKLKLQVKEELPAEVEEPEEELVREK
ncbi:MAG TPA: DNA-directed RNA polymerase subunit beta' [bacterium]|nr:DNA-directed RNA polymerase subunit beta' [bacterium]